MAFVLTKADRAMSDAGEAREALALERIRQYLGPLVADVETSMRVRHAACFAVSAFGFRGSEEREDGVCLLKADSEHRPSGCLSVLLWSILHGLDGCDSENDSVDLDSVSARLATDFLSLGGWRVPLKGDAIRHVERAGS